MGMATVMAIKVTNKVPANIGTAPNDPVLATWSSLIAVWGLQFNPNKKSKIGTLSKNLKASKISENTIPTVVIIATIEQIIKKVVLFFSTACLALKFGYSFLDQNRDKVKAAKVDGVFPEFEDISSGKYPVSRSLFFYVKNAHATVIPGIKEYVAEFTSSKAIGNDGYLIDKGLIPLPQDEMKKFQADGKKLTKFDGKVLKK